MPEIFIDRAPRRTVALLLVSELLWGLGCYLVLPATTLPAYLRALGASPAVIGILVLLMGALPLVLQMFGRMVLERFPHRKRGLILLYLVVAAPYLLIPFADYWLVESHRLALIALVITLLALSQVIVGLCIPVWLDLLAQVIPIRIRGRYFGVSAAFFAFGGILGGLALTGLEKWLGNAVFRGAFLGAATAYLISLLTFHLAPIPETAFSHPREPSLLSRLRSAFRACHPSMGLGRFVISSFAQTLALSIVPFLVIYASDPAGLRLPKGIFSQITWWSALGAMAGALLLGGFVDRHGPRAPWVAVTLVVPTVVLLYPHGDSRPILIICSLLVGLLSSHWAVGMPALLELSPEGDKSGYIAVANLAAFPPAAGGPLLIAFLIEGPGYHAAFLLAALAGLAAFTSGLMMRFRATRPLPPPTSQ